jgi:tight adherence protein C
MFEDGSTMDLVILAMAGAAAVALAYTLWRGVVYKDPYQERLKTMVDRRAAYKAAAIGGLKASGKKKAKGVLAEMAESLTKALKLGGAQTATKKAGGVSLRMFLARAAIRHKNAPEYFLLAKAGLPFLFAGLVAVYIFGLSKYNPSPTMMIAICGGAAGLGYLAPSLYVKNRAAKRKKALRKQVPDALDLLVVCAEAGLTLNAALDRVVREMARSAGEISDELGLLLVELNFLDERRKAFQNLCDRTDMDEFRSMSNTLMQAEKYGTPLAHALRVLGHEYRQDRLTRAEEKAARLPAILTVPMIVFILPCLFIVIIGPAIIKTIDSLGRMG